VSRAGLERVTAAALVLFAAASFTGNVADNDLWGHLRYGRDFLQGGVVTVDPYSYLTAGRRWVEHEWGAEVLLALVWNAWGAPGLIALKALLGAVAVALVARLGWERSRSMAAVACVGVPAVLGLFPWFGIRPQVFTHVLFAFTLYAFQRAREGRPTAARLLPFAMLAWANLHGGFLAGLGILGLATAVEWLACRHRGAPPPRALALIVVACALATAVSPYGPGYPLSPLRDALMARPDITEWRPLGVAVVRDFPTLIVVPLLAAVAAAALALDRRRVEPVEVVVLAVTCLLAIRHVRHAPFFLLACVWALPRHLAALAPRAAAARGALVAAGLVGGLAVARVALALGAVDHVAVPARAYPIGAVAFMAREGIGGNVAVDFNWGSYLNGKCFPRCRVSIDGRYEAAYAPETYAMHRALRTGAPGWERLLADPRTEVALLDARAPGTARVGALPGWRLVYRDPVAALFVRDRPRFRALIARFGAAPATAPLADGVFP
jgi:hypothetical protein